MTWTLTALFFSITLSALLILLCVKWYRFFGDYKNLVCNVSQIADVLETLIAIVHEISERELSRIRNKLKDSDNNEM